jgi:hypothetical protein
MMRWAVMRGIRAGVPSPGWQTVLRRNAAGFSPRIRGMMSRHTWCGRDARIGLNLLGAAMAALFARSSIVFCGTSPFWPWLPAGNAGRAIFEERVLAAHSDYAPYRNRVRRRLLPGGW